MTENERDNRNYIDKDLIGVNSAQMSKADEIAEIMRRSELFYKADPEISSRTNCVLSSADFVTSYPNPLRVSKTQSEMFKHWRCDRCNGEDSVWQKYAL